MTIQTNTQHIPKTMEEAEMRAKIMMVFIIYQEIKAAMAIKEKLDHEIDWLRHKIDNK